MWLRSRAAARAASGSPPPAEYVGKARVFRATIDAEDASVGDLMRDIVAPLQARLRTGKRTQRLYALITAARRWRTEVGTAGRLHLDIQLGKGELRLTEWRCTAGHSNSTRGARPRGGNPTSAWLRSWYSPPPAHSAARPV
jgi:hypothetical protein